MGNASAKKDDSILKIVSRKFSQKAVSGKVITIVISLVVALFALIILWAFMTNSVPLIRETVENIISGIQKSLCKDVPVVSDICRWWVGG